MLPVAKAHPFSLPRQQEHPATLAARQRPKAFSGNHIIILVLNPGRIAEAAAVDGAY